MVVCQEDLEPFTVDSLAEYISGKGGDQLYSSTSESASAATSQAALPLSAVAEQLTRIHEVGECLRGGLPFVCIRNGTRYKPMQGNGSGPLHGPCLALPDNRGRRGDRHVGPPPPRVHACLEKAKGKMSTDYVDGVRQYKMCVHETLQMPHFRTCW